MLSHGHHKNLSFFAFTATPKSKTLQLFGEKLPDGRIVPFHVYSMRQAIEEGRFEEFRRENSEKLVKRI